MNVELKEAKKVYKETVRDVLRPKSMPTLTVESSGGIWSPVILS